MPSASQIAVAETVALLQAKVLALETAAELARIRVGLAVTDEEAEALGAQEAEARASAAEAGEQRAHLLRLFPHLEAG